tara:strand:+ start:1006 stop:3996 length:2991 start_codon:yes stop_codon:yes gene_type:complete
MSNSVFTNNLRLEEIASGERSGTWGTATNTNLSLITDAFAFGTEAITTNATTHSTTMNNASDSQTGAPRSMYLKYTGTLNATCTVTLGPNDVSKVWIIENATSGSQILTIKQGTGSGSTVNIPNGSVKVVYSDGGGTGANVVDAFTDLDVAGTFAVAGNTTVGGTFTSTGAVTANAGVSIDNFNIDGTTIALSSGDMLLDGAVDIILDAAGGDVTLKADGTPFGSLTNTSGNLIIKSGTTTAATFSGANVTLAGTVVTGGLTTLGGNLVIPNAGNIGSVGDPDAISISSSGVVTLTQNLIIPDGGNIGSATDTDAIAISSAGVVTMDQIPIFSAGINVSGGSIAGSLSSTTQGNITATGALNSGSITSGFGAIDNGSSAITTTGTITFGNLVGGAGGKTVTGILDEDDFNSDSDSKLATQQSIKAYISSVTGGGGSTLTIQNQGSSLSTGAGTINFVGTGVVASGSGSTKTVTITPGVSSTGSRNTIIGSTALEDHNSFAEDNTAVGFAAAKNVDNDDGNTAIGAYSFGGVIDTATSTGTHSSGGPGTAVGYKALGNITSAERCTAVGYEALLSITVGIDNVAVGYQAGKDVVGGNSNVYVGSRCAENCTGTGNTAIGHQAFLFRSGNYDHSVAMGYTTGYHAIGDNITLLGSYAGYGNNSATCDHTGTTAVGYKSLQLLQSGNDNTSVGFEAGQQMTTGAGNVALGYEAMNKFTTGSYNIGIGYQGLFGNSSSAGTGSDNIGIGRTASSTITSGSDNISIGRSSGSSLATGSDNIFVGRSAGTSATGAVSDNVYIGGEAGQGNASNEYNVAVGYQALGANSNSTYRSTAVGWGAGNTITGGYNLTVLGHNAEPSSATAVNEFTLGDANVATLRCNDQSIGTLSDARDKTNIVDSPFGLDFINSVRPVQFKWDRRNLVEGDLTAFKNGKTRLGFIAQEFQQAMPNNENDILDLVYESNPERLEAKYGNLIPILTKAIQQLSDKNDALEARIKLLEG